MDNTYTKIDDDTFEITQPSTEQFSVTALQDELSIIQTRMIHIQNLLQGANTAGVGNAQIALSSVTKMINATTDIAASNTTTLNQQATQ